MCSKKVEAQDDLAEVEAAPVPDDSALKSVGTLAAEMKTVEGEIAVIRAQLEAKEARFKEISENELPTAILSTGLRAVPLADGTTIEVITKYHAGIAAARQEEAFGWLREHGHDDLIKKTVTAQFGRGEDSSAELALMILTTNFPQNKVDAKAAVHSGTLTAFVREQLDAGVDVPHDLFGVYTHRYAKITKIEPRKSAL